MRSYTDSGDPTEDKTNDITQGYVEKLPQSPFLVRDLSQHLAQRPYVKACQLHL